VGGFVGEQFALPEAVEALRAVRRAPEDREVIVVAASDPLNLVGIILPGGKVAPQSALAIAYRNGVPQDVAPMGALLARLHQTAATAARSDAGTPFRERRR
jgi:hypothetical protein